MCVTAPSQVVTLEGGESPVYQDALKKNLSQALRVALTLLPDHFSREELFMAVAGLSFTGRLSRL